MDLNRVSELTPEVTAEIENLFQYHVSATAGNAGQYLVKADIENLFQYHPASGQRVKAALLSAYTTIIAEIPPCPARTRALNKIAEARWDVNGF